MIVPILMKEDRNILDFRKIKLPLFVCPALKRLFIFALPRLILYDVMSYFQDCIYLFVFLRLLVSLLVSESDLTNEWK